MPKYRRQDDEDRLQYSLDGIKKHGCPSEGCTKIYITKTHLKRHFLISHTDYKGQNLERIPCMTPECPKSFTNRTSMLRHQQNAHINAKRHTCEYCPERFQFKAQWRRHQPVHNDQYPHRCPVCGKGCTSLRQLAKHGVAHRKKSPKESIPKIICADGSIDHERPDPKNKLGQLGLVPGTICDDELMSNGARVTRLGALHSVVEALPIPNGSQLESSELIIKSEIDYNDEEIYSNNETYSEDEQGLDTDTEQEDQDTVPTSYSTAHVPASSNGTHANKLEFEMFKSEPSNYYEGENEWDKGSELEVQKSTHWSSSGVFESKPTLEVPLNDEINVGKCEPHSDTSIGIRPNIFESVIKSEPICKSEPPSAASIRPLIFESVIIKSDPICNSEPHSATSIDIRPHIFESVIIKSEPICSEGESEIASESNNEILKHNSELAIIKSEQD